MHGAFWGGLGVLMGAGIFALIDPPAAGIVALLGAGFMAYGMAKERAS